MNAFAVSVPLKNTAHKVGIPLSFHINCLEGTCTFCPITVFLGKLMAYFFAGMHPSVWRDNGMHLWG